VFDDLTAQYRPHDLRTKLRRQHSVLRRTVLSTAAQQLLNRHSSVAFECAPLCWLLLPLPLPLPASPLLLPPAVDCTDIIESPCAVAVPILQSAPRHT
jgi:hypothetical protein